MIYTFYSYKGGVGRSMALANVAEWFYRKGLRVIMVDWDLEAPGLETYFYSSAADLDIVRSQLGLIDTLMAYKRVFPRLRVMASEMAGQSKTGESPDWLETLRNSKDLPSVSDALYPIHRPETNDDKAPGLWLLPAGWRAGDRFPVYAQAVQSFDWTDFYASFEGDAYFEWLREQMVTETRADVVLIDSRTGVTEMGGVCTRQLADIVVSFCVPNAQNLDGICAMAESFGRAEIISKRGRELDVVMVPARIDSNELGLRKIFEDRFRERLDRFTPSAFNAVTANFWNLQIPYLAKYAYAEFPLAIDDSTAPELSNAYKKLAAHLALLAQGTSALQIRSAMAEEVNREFKDRLPSVFISAFGEEGQEIARALRQRLSEQGVALWPNLSDMKGKGDIWQQTMGILDQAKALVLIMTTEAVRSSTLRKQWRYARQQGVTVYLVALHARAMNATSNQDGSSSLIEEYESTKSRAGSEPLPQWLRQETYYDAETEWDKLASILQRPITSTRVPFMAPDLPEDYVEQREFLTTMKEALFSLPQTSNSGCSIFAVCGAGGSGKTAAAIRLCQDEAADSYFEDGILWVTLGPNANVLPELIKLYAALTGERKIFIDEEGASRELSAILSGKAVLLVLDDASSVEQLRFFDPGGNRCVRLITTRDAGIASAIGARVFPLPQLTDSEALQLITFQLDVSTGDSSALNELTQSLGGWPLALKLANAELRNRADQTKDLSAAITSLNQSVKQEGLLVFDRTTGPEGKGLISKKLQAVLAQALPGNADPERYMQLASLPADKDLRLSDAAALWKVDEASAEKLINRLAGLSLLELQPDDGTIRMPALFRSFILGQEHLNDKLEAVFSRFPEPKQEASLRLLTRLVRFTAPGEVGSDTRQRVKISDFDAPSQELAESLAEAKFVTIEKAQGGGAPIVQIVSDAYLKEWKRLSEWIKQDREFLVWRQQLRSKIAEWETTKRDQGALLSGVPLDVAAAYRNQRHDELNEAETNFIDESLREVELIKARERQTIIQARRRWRAAIAAAVLVLFATGAFVVWQRVREKTQRAANLSESYNNLGSLEVGNKNYSAAFNAFSKAIEAKPDNANPYLNRARIRLKEKQVETTEQALADYSAAIKLKPDLAGAYFERADIYSESASTSTLALADYNNAIKLKADYWNAYLNRGYLYESLKNFESALADYNKVIDSNSEEFKRVAYLRRGTTYAAVGNKELATNDLMVATEADDRSVRNDAASGLLSLRFTPPQGLKVRLYYGGSNDGPVIEVIRTALLDSGFSVPAKQFITRTTSGDVRYYSTAKEISASAAIISKIVSETLVKKSGVKLDMTPWYIGDKFPNMPPGVIEVWFPPLQR
jgi:tetratricopeptide (TPR) repeat protein